MRDIDERGMRAVMADAIRIAIGRHRRAARVASTRTCGSRGRPGVGTPVPGGATYREAHLAMEMIHDARTMVGLDIVEINPVLDSHNRTAELAVAVARSAFGLRIL